MCLNCTVTKKSVNKILRGSPDWRIYFLLRLSGPTHCSGQWLVLGGWDLGSPKLQHRCFLSGTMKSGNRSSLSCFLGLGTDQTMTGHCWASWRVHLSLELLMRSYVIVQLARNAYFVTVLSRAETWRHQPQHHVVPPLLAAASFVPCRFCLPSLLWEWRLIKLHCSWVGVQRVVRQCCAMELGFILARAISLLPLPCVACSLAFLRSECTLHLTQTALHRPVAVSEDKIGGTHATLPCLSGQGCVWAASRRGLGAKLQLSEPYIPHSRAVGHP